MYAEARKQILRAAERIEGGHHPINEVADLSSAAWRLLSFEVTGRSCFMNELPREEAMMFLYFVGHSDLEA